MKTYQISLADSTACKNSVEIIKTEHTYAAVDTERSARMNEHAYAVCNTEPQKDNAPLC